MSSEVHGPWFLQTAQLLETFSRHGKLPLTLCVPTSLNDPFEFIPSCSGLYSQIFILLWADYLFLDFPLKPYLLLIISVANDYVISSKKKKGNLITEK